MSKLPEQMLDDARLEVIAMKKRIVRLEIKAKLCEIDVDNAIELTRVWMFCACMSFGMLLFFILSDWI